MCAWRLTLEVSAVDSRFCQTTAASPAEPGVFPKLIIIRRRLRTYRGASSAALRGTLFEEEAPEGAIRSSLIQERAARSRA